MDFLASGGIQSKSPFHSFGPSSKLLRGQDAPGADASYTVALPTSDVDALKSWI